MQKHRSLVALITVLALGGVTTPGCVRAVSNVKVPTPSNALGDENYRMIPVPSEDDSILGRIVMEEPGEATSFEAEARPNPCEKHLDAVRDDPLQQQISRAQRLDVSGTGGATLRGFGFSSSASNLTHLVFDLRTNSKRVRRDTSEYLACCREFDCGFGYISTLVHGDGEYAAGRETGVSAEIDYRNVVGTSGKVNIHASERKTVSGFVAAVVTPHAVVTNMSDSRSRPLLISGATSLGLGLAGSGLLVATLVRGPKLQEDHNNQPQDRDRISEQIKTNNALTVTGAVGGGVLLALGVTLLVVGARGRQKKELALIPSLTPANAGADLRLSF